MKKIVRIDVAGGVANVWNVPKGVTVILRDYDCTDHSGGLKDKDGNHYHQTVYEN